jgi:hypothetical protein
MLTNTTPRQDDPEYRGIFGRLDRTLATNEPRANYGLTRPGSILNIAAGVVRNSNFGIKAMAIATGKKSNVLNNELSGCDRHKLGLIDAINHSMIAGDYSVVMEWARLGGLSVVHLPPVGLVDDIELMTCYAQFMKEVGDVAEQLNETLADRKVTASEAEKVNKEAREVIQSLYCFLTRLEALIEE